MNIEYIGRDAIVQTEKICYSFQTVDRTPREFAQDRPLSKLDWNDQYSFLGDYIVYPYGTNDDLPKVIREVVQNNYIAPGILKKKTQLLWGSGPKLYQEVFKDGQLVRDWQDNDEIKAWMDSWNAEDYILKCITDYQHLEGVFTRFETTRGFNIGQPTIAALHVESPDRTRLGTLRGASSKKPTVAVVSESDISKLNANLKYKVYRLFDYNNPFKYANSILYSNMYSFCTDYYTVPDLYGSLEWLNRSTAIPLILKALSKNSINLKYHIISPQAFWDAKEEQMKDNCTKRGIEYKSSMLEDYKTALLNQVSEVLSGEENTGKFWHTTKSFTVDGTNLIEHGWEIKVIDQNIKDFVEAQIKISQRADHALSSGIGLHSSLGNVSETGKSDSGSEQLYALKNYMITGVDIPEMIVLKAINYAIKANFPKTKLKLGFYHIQPQAEQNITPSDRLKNQV